MRPIEIRDGERFGRLVVLHRLDPAPTRHRWYVLRCDCGAECRVTGARLNSGTTRSCGCLRREVAAAACRERGSHGHYVGGASPTYRTWQSMVTRCTRPDYIGWRYYGGRGITVCERWRTSFEAFLADMGERPEGLTLDRVDPDGNYEPSNCRWATALEQRHNRSRRAA